MMNIILFYFNDYDSVGPYNNKNGPLTTEIAILNLENSPLKFLFY